eukprot:5051837-Amphidinium_carterae.3
MGTWLVDLRRFYEFVAHKDLFADGRVARVPLRLLRLAVSFYQGPKFVVWEGLCTKPKGYAGGIIPGCSCAPALARALLTPLLAELENMGPGQIVFSVIDDLAIARFGSQEEVLQGLCSAGDKAIKWFADRQLPVSPGKCQLLGSTSVIREGLQRKFGAAGFVLENSVRHLGIEATASRRRCGKLRQGKLTMAYRKLRRLSQLRNTGAQVFKVARCGPLAAVEWGSEVWGLTLRQLTRLRSGMVRAARKWPKTCGVQLPF